MLRRPTITRIFVVMIVASLIAMAGFLWGFSVFSRDVILKTALRRRLDAAAQVEKNVVFELGRLDRRIRAISELVHTQAVNVNDPQEMERVLLAALLEEVELNEASFTHVTSSGWDEDGEIELSPVGRWQVAVYRDGLGKDAPVYSRWTHGTGTDAFEATVERADLGGSAPEVIACTDPTTHPTFKTAASRDFSGEPLRSDLHLADHGSKLERPIVLTTQVALLDSDRHVFGVLKVGLASQRIDAAVQNVALEDHHIFLAKVGGETPEEVEETTHLVTRSKPEEDVLETENDYRFDLGNAHPAVQKVLQHPEFRSLAVANPNVQTTEPRQVTSALTVGGEKYVFTASRLVDTLGWVVGIVVPETVYTASLDAQRRKNLFIFGVVAAGLILLAWLSLRAVRNGLGEVEAATNAMLRYDFAPAEPKTGLMDVKVVLKSLERAKTALRSLGKYAPVDLVKQLYANNVEPKLGGEQQDVTVMFTDLRGFTELSERLSTDRLAQVLGLYLQEMTRAIQSTGGTIDKFIGDAVMALWNVPTRVLAHPLSACEAILKCREATEVLFKSEAFEGLEPMVTRFGLHMDRVMVGHFGAPERMSFTALGDGVNLAARLESLCKMYGVTNLVSESVVHAARERYAFRLIDQVAVKGKTKPVRVYELLGRGAMVLAEPMQKYTRAWELYSSRQFEDALQLFASIREVDGPAATLHARCRFLISQPPPPEWNGVHVLHEK